MSSVSDINFDSYFNVGKWLIEPESGYIRKNNSEIKLEPKVMSLLVYLAKHSGHVVSRQELEESIWTDMVVGYDALSGGIIKLRKALGDDSHAPLYIETISKKGYRLIADVEPAHITDDFKQVNNKSKLSIRPDFFLLYKLSAIALVFMVLLGLWFVFDLPFHLSATTGEETLSSEVKDSVVSTKIPSLLVLPFKNISNDPKQDYFSDGITDDIITDLSKIGSLHVIAAHTSYFFKDKEIDLGEIAKDLNVQYFIEGSVQKSGKQLRINTRLTNIDNGQNIWAERFDGHLDKLFEMQDRITRKIITEMFITLPNHESNYLSSRTTKSYKAYDAFLKGQRYSNNRTKQGYDLTIEEYQNAVNYDPEYARAYGALAVTLTFGFRHKWSELSLYEARNKALELVNKAVALNQYSPHVYWSQGFVHLFRKEYDIAEFAALRAIKLSPNYADGYGLLAFIANWRGKAEQATQYIKKATSLNPYHTFDYPWNLGLAYYTLGRYKESIVALEDALERNETAMFPRLYLAASYVRTGDLDEAEWQVIQAVTQRPGTTVSHLRNTLPYENPELKEQFLNDLIKAGLDL